MGVEQYFALGVVVGMISGTLSVLVAIAAMRWDRFDSDPETNAAASGAATIGRRHDVKSGELTGDGAGPLFMWTAKGWEPFSVPVNRGSTPGGDLKPFYPPSLQRPHPRRRRESRWIT